MPVLKNARREIFAQEIVKGSQALKAYEVAGFAKSAANASTLKKQPEVVARINELLGEMQSIHADGMKIAVAQTGLNAGRVLLELAKLGLSNMADYVKISEDDGSVKIDLSHVTRDQMAAVQEIQTETYYENTGEGKPREVTRVKLKLFDKTTPLVNIGKHFGMFPSQVKIDSTVKIETIDEVALLERIRSRLAGVSERAPKVINPEGNETLRIGEH